jgi:glucose-6-phosphate isomerase
MYFSYFDSESIDEASVARGVKKLASYRKEVQRVVSESDDRTPEYALVHPQQPAVHDEIDAVRSAFKGIKHLVLVGIGGSNLGTEAVHAVLDTGKVKLHTLDTVSAHDIETLLQTLTAVKKPAQLAVCVISKSGGTAETMVNAGVVLDALESRFGKDIYARTLFIGNVGTEFMKTGKRLGVRCIGMPEIVGGRYSVSTEVGLIPLALLGHDTDAFIAGLLDASSEEFEAVVAENASRIAAYTTKNYRHYNFFAFEPRLERLGAWYRQLAAESLGKETDRAGKPVTKGFLPTISTPVELHSVGQLFLSGFPGVYTDFVTFDDDSIDYAVPKKGIAKTYGKHTAQEVATAIYGGVMAAYQDRGLPYRSTIFDENLTYSLGLFMGMRMLETMYVAELMNLNAFDQPNVELYKSKTKDILGL